MIGPLWGCPDARPQCSNDWLNPLRAAGATDRASSTLAGLTGCDLPKEVDGDDLTEILRSADAPGREYFISQTWDAPEQKYPRRRRLDLRPQQRYVTAI